MSTWKGYKKITAKGVPSIVLDHLPLCQMDIVEVTGHNLEARGREEVNRLLEAGWWLLHIYTLKYQEDGVWSERPIAILGRLRDSERPDSLLSERSPTKSGKLRRGGDLLP